MVQYHKLSGSKDETGKEDQAKVDDEASGDDGDDDDGDEGGGGVVDRDFDYILDEIVGGGGWWQWKKCLLFVPSYLTVGNLPLLLHLFTAYTPPHRCLVEGCDVSG